MKLHLKTLCRKFHQAKEEEPVSKGETNLYLLEKVLWPTLQGDAPCFGEIDYDQFDEDDVATLVTYYESLSAASQKLSQFMTAVASTQAIPCRTRQFC